VETVDFPGPGMLVRHRVVPRELAPRFVDVWLPPGVAGAPGSIDEGERHPGTVVGPDPAKRRVVYCHDGQNLFLPGFSFAGVPWSLHTAALAAARATRRPAPVVVGIWNAGEARYGEYLPPEPELRPTGSGVVQLERAVASGGARADAYVRMLTGEVLPLVESAHGVSTRRADRIVLGSSMGGLAALYCALTRPGVFGGAACVSTNFIVGGEPLVDWFAAHLPKRLRLRLWFDRGTETLDREYGPTQDRMDAALRSSTLMEGRHWRSTVYEGADHSEGAWAGRAPEILSFFLPAGSARRPLPER
jgi:predicted alpha/beta superfamily hydrolase